MQWEAELEKREQQKNAYGIFSENVKQLGWRGGSSRGVMPEKAGKYVLIDSEII